MLLSQLALYRTLQVEIGIACYDDTVTVRIGDELHTELEPLRRRDEAKRKAIVRALMLTEYKFVEVCYCSSDTQAPLRKGGCYFSSLRVVFSVLCLQDGTAEGGGSRHP